MSTIHRPLQPRAGAMLVPQEVLLAPSPPMMTMVHSPLLMTYPRIMKLGVGQTAPLDPQCLVQMVPQNLQLIVTALLALLNTQLMINLPPLRMKMLDPLLAAIWKRHNLSPPLKVDQVHQTKGHQVVVEVGHGRARH